THLLQPVVQRLALEILEHEVVGSVLVSDVVQDADVGMVQAGDGPGFALEALAQVLIVGQVLGEDLDRDRAGETGVLRAVYLAHAPGPQWSEDLVGAETGARGEGHAGLPGCSG